jgi:AraC family transcriptional regulator
MGRIGRFECDACGSRFRGLELPLHRFGGARAVRVVHPERQQIGAHRHELAFLSLPRLGAYSDESNDGEALIAAPAATFHPAGTCHANRIGQSGLETITIEFDPAWLRPESGALPLDRLHLWIGGPVALAARRLAEAWENPRCAEPVLAGLTARFLQAASRQETSRRPPWLDDLLQAVGEGAEPSTSQLARRLGLHPAWLARAYRSSMGEGLHEMLRRRRVERASGLLRRTDLPLAEIAIETGFCDQSHMNRAFRALSGRTPLQVRRERQQLSNFA